MQQIKSFILLIQFDNSIISVLTYMSFFLFFHMVDTPCIKYPKYFMQKKSTILVHVNANVFFTTSAKLVTFQLSYHKKYVIHTCIVNLRSLKIKNNVHRMLCKLHHQHKYPYCFPGNNIIMIH